MKTSRGQRKNKALSVKTPYQVSRARYMRAFSAARAMYFWCPRISAKHLTIAAAFSAALAFTPSATLAQSPFTFDLRTVDGTNGFVLNGVREGRDAAGDVNGDGFDDLFVRAGRTTHVLFGGNGELTSSFDFNTIDGTNGFNVSLPDSPDASVRGAGDVNGDGIDDLIIGAPSGYLSNNLSESYVVFGQNGGFSPSLDLSTLNGNNGFAINGFAAGENIGFPVSGAGDVNGDGFDDVIIGSTNFYIPGVSRGYVVFGQGSGVASAVDINTLNGTNGFVLDGGGRGFGSAVSDAGDFNGDGFDDVIIGNFTGGGHLVFGQADGFSSTFDVDSIDGTNGATFGGADLSQFFPEGQFSSAGDVNGDGFDDIIIGAQFADGYSGSREGGQSFVVFGNGSDSAVAALFDLSTLDGSNGFVLNGGEARDFFGRVSVARGMSTGMVSMT